MLNTIAAILVFSLIVLIHEFGHFLLAKLNGIGVIEFSLGMGPRLFSFEKGETRYSVKALPFGGSCMMLGEDEDINAENAFQNKSPWARFSVIAAGPVFNFILAFLLAMVVVGYTGYTEPVISGVMEGFPAEAAGMQAGDRIVELNGKKIVEYRDISLHNLIHPGETVEIIYERDGIEYGVVLEPQYSEEDGAYLMGILAAGGKKADGIGDLIFRAAYEVKFQIEATLQSLKMLFGGRFTADDIGGPVKIIAMVGDTVEAVKPAGFVIIMLNLMNISIILSANLGVMNLLPIPALDGGRIFFILLEILRGKPIDKEKEGMVHMAGLMVLMAFMIFVLFNDIRSLL